MTNNRQDMTAADGGRITTSPQTQVEGTGNAVLNNITIAEGGTLVVHPPPGDLPPHPEAVRAALDQYLRTLLERYQFLSLHGLGAGGSQQTQIALRAVFINLLTTTRLT